MANFRIYEVLDDYDPTKDYGIQIYPYIAQYLVRFKRGQTLNVANFIKENGFLIRSDGYKSSKFVIYKSIEIAKKIGLLKNISNGEHTPIKDFATLETISYCMEQLRSSRRKNLHKISPFDSTQRSYLYALWDFHKWITGKEFEFTSFIQTSETGFEKKASKTVLNGLEHLLLLYKSSHSSEPDFIKIIKKYLLDSKHQGKKLSTLLIAYHAIIAYFERNEASISFKIDLRAKYSGEDKEHEQNLSLEDLFKMLTVGNPTITQKAVLLCKFHRGLDTSTFVDRFNFQAWPQLVSWLGTEDFEKWDLTRCPVPIKLTRIKTGFAHVGYLDRDAIEALIDYLRYRFERTGVRMSDSQAIFLNGQNKPISDAWIRMHFFALAKKAGIQKPLLHYKTTVRYEKDSHELRDLLKSTLIECGTRYDVADHCIGHKPKDSYEKQIDLYSESARIEFAKASHKLNVFTNFSNSLKGDANITTLQKQIEEQRIELEKVKQKLLFSEKYQKTTYS